VCDGVDVATLDATQRAELRRAKIGFVFQSFHLLPRMSALDNVILPLIYAGVPSEQRRNLGLAALTSVGLAERAPPPSQRIVGRTATARGNCPRLDQ
jgi:predicted ABC-type transport system involved in lysophospholipase L1 biosynthesis ATPase subunit